MIDAKVGDVLRLELEESTWDEVAIAFGSLHTHIESSMKTGDEKIEFVITRLLDRPSVEFRITKIEVIQ